MVKPKFNPEQKRELARLGVLGEQISAVEAILPNICVLLVLRRPTLANVRDHLESLQRALAFASDAISTLENKSASHSAAQEAALRLQMADFDLNRNTNTESLHKTVESLKAASNVVDRARQDLPQEQRRSLLAHPLPIRVIERALLDGFVNAHTDKPMPNYNVERSASAGSACRTIMGICYAAAGATNTDPERAIRAHIAQEKKRAQEALRELGQQGVRKSDLLS